MDSGYKELARMAQENNREMRLEREWERRKEEKREE